MYEVFFTKRALTDEAGTAVLDADGIPEGMPFLVESETLAYPQELNAFFRRLPTQGAGSPRTWAVHAYDIAAWCRFLISNRAQPSVWDATRADAEAYFRARRLLPSGSQLTPASWNVTAQHLSNLYDYAIAKQLSKTNPFRRQYSFSINGVEVDSDHALIRERHAHRDSMRFHSRKEYQLLRLVGFQGMRPDGSRDTNYTPRSRERNVAFMELLANTGMRVGEATALVRHEVLMPSSDEFAELVVLPLPEAITKNQKHRKAFLPLVTQAELMAYVELERERAVLAANKAKLYEDDDWILVTDWDVEGYTVGTGRRLWFNCPPATRARLIEVRTDGLRDPFALWLSTNGKPVKREAWTPVFKVAEARCRAYGVQLSTSPHKLRHTYAVHMLAFLERQAARPPEDGELRFKGNSVRMVQLLLGHASSDTTVNSYLPSIELMSDLLDVAGGEYAKYLAAELD